LGVVGESGSGKEYTGAGNHETPAPILTDRTGKIFFDGRDILKLDDEALREMRGKEVSIVSRIRTLPSTL